MSEPTRSHVWTDTERLAALDRYQILDTPPEPAFDDVVRLAAELLGVPIAAVNLIANGRQWFKSEIGLGVREMPLDNSICALAILTPGSLVVPDTRQDPRFACNPLVTSEPGLRFYAGEVLETPQGVPLGTLCVLDHKPRPQGLNAQERFILHTLSRQIISQLELRRAVIERDQALAARQQFEALTRQIVDSATDYAIISTNMKGDVTSWNAGARKILGWTMEEMLGQSAERFFTPEDQATGRVAVEMEQALAKGRGNDERWHMNKDGARFWASGAMMPLKDQEGLITGFVRVLRDRTEERRREQRLAMLAQTSSGLLVARDPDEVLGPVLEESAGLLGFDQSYSYVLAPDGAHLQLTYCIGVSDEVRAARANVPFDAILCGIVAKSRQPLYINDLQATTDPRYKPGRDAGLTAFVAFPVIASDRLYGVLSFASFTRATFDAEAVAFFGTLARYLAIVRERLDSEAALREWAETLEQRVEERTAELQKTEAALRQSQKMEAVGQLTGGIAHDFNNLLTGIIGSLELLQTKIAQGRVNDLDRYINAAFGSSKRAAALTHRLLAFSRRQTLDPCPTDINRLIRTMEDLIRRTVGPSITIEVVGAAGLWTVLVDPNQLENALLNLCINARDAMPEGGHITIETANAWLDERAARERSLPPGQYLSLCVTDTGSGMTPEVAARAFDPFFTTKPLGMGTGLGLSMIYGFVRQSGGQVRIYSELGQGTTMCLYFPRHHGEESAVEELVSATDQSRASQGETVLVVDDEPAVRMLVTEVLEDLGYRAIEAADGAAGLHVLQSGMRVDLLVTDVGLPGGMNGRQLADAGRVARPGLRVLFITGYAENAVVGHGHLEPGMHVLTKPFAMDVLTGRIRDLITG